jgi:hypothetical protein
MTLQYFPEITGSGGIPAIVAGWWSPLDHITSGYIYFMLVFITFFVMFQKVDNPMLVGLVGLILLPFLITTMPQEMILYIVIFIALPLSAVYNKLFVKTHM